MKPQWDVSIGQIEAAYQLWQSVQNNLPSSFTYQNTAIPTSELNSSFSEIVGLIKSVANREDIDAVLLAIHQPNIISVCATFPQIGPNSTANPPVYLEQILNSLWSLKSSIVWLIPTNSRESYVHWIKDTDILGKIESVSALQGALTESLGQLSQSAQEAKRSEEEAKAFLEKVTSYEREAANAKTNAEASSSLASSNKEQIVTLLTQLEEGNEKQKALLEDINSLSKQASLVLEGTSKAGLAASFGARRDRLEKTQKIWIGAFGLGILILIVEVYLTTSGHLKFTPLINSAGAIDAWGVLARVLVTGPAVWFTWFAAKQYGHTMRLIEDYAFKEASALAFVGYKREMGEDAEMIKLVIPRGLAAGTPPH